jgi:two-component system chemotaxis sensor kinase CheA
VVIKSLEQHYKRVEGVAGATILGDGSVALILDVESLALSINQSVHLAAAS